jgi:hypothetical protein
MAASATLRRCGPTRLVSSVRIGCLSSAFAIELKRARVLDGGEIDALVLRYRRWHAPPRRRRGRLVHDPD